MKTEQLSCRREFLQSDPGHLENPSAGLVLSGGGLGASPSDQGHVKGVRSQHSQSGSALRRKCWAVQ